MYCCDKKMETVRTTTLKDKVIREKFCDICCKLIRTVEKESDESDNNQTK